MSAGEIRGYCTLCRSRCGTINVVDGDALIRVVPDPDHPTGQAMCMKGRAAPELVHSPHRVLHPMRRTRPKGDADPGWERISWDTALTEIAAKLDTVRRENGPEAVAFGVTTPSGTPLSDSIDWIERFVRAFGSPNISYATEICNWHKDFAHAFTFGCGMPTADYAHADLIILWGHNPANTWLAQAHAIGVGRAAGAKMLVIDPQRTALAAQADTWLPVRPGTDAALALGLAHLLIDSRRYDDAFVREWTNAPLLVRDDTGLLLRAQDCLATANAPPAPHAMIGAKTNTNTQHGDADSTAGENAGGNTAFVAWHTARARPSCYDTRHDGALQGTADFALHGAFEVPLTDGGSVICRPAFDLLATQCAAYPPARVAALTGVAEAQLHAAAALLADSRKIAYHAWTGIGQHANATQNERAIAVLYALTGSFDRTGGNRVYTRQPAPAMNGLDLISPTQRAKAIGLADRPLGPPAMGWITARDMYRAMLDGVPYPVRAMFAFGTNPLASQADTAQAQAALQQLEFHVHCDLFMTPSASYADIFLPVNTPWEHEGLRLGFEISERAEAQIQLRTRMVSPRGESRSDNDIVFDLAKRLGFGHLFFDGDLDRAWNHQLAPLGLTVEALRAAPAGVQRPLTHRDRKYAEEETIGGVRGFATDTRRVELYSEKLHRHGYFALPTYTPAPDAPSDDRFPLLLTTAKNGYYCHSQHRALASLRRRAPLPQAGISPALAARRSIAAGDWLRIRSRHGEARFVARVDPDLGDDIVVGEFGWWQACPELGRPSFPIRGAGSSNYNSLISAEHADPVSGSVPMRAFACEIARDPVSDPAKRPWAGLRAAHITDVRDVADGVVHIALAAADGGLLPDFEPGQHITLRVSNHGAAPLTRAYSLTGAATRIDRRHYTIAVRRQGGKNADGTPFHGLMSTHLHTRLKVGDAVEIGAPSGQFVLPLASPQPVVLIAGGIGITPFLCYLESLLDEPAMPEVHLHYANRHEATHAFRERLGELRRQLPRLTVIDYYSAPRPEDRISVANQTSNEDLTSSEDLRSTEAPGNQALDAAVVSDALIAARARVYLCGPDAMMKNVSRGLIARGMPAFDIFSEVFRSPPVFDATSDQHFPVTFARTQAGAKQWSPAAGTLLTFSESLGLNLPSGCRVGQCESCAVNIISGQVRHLHGGEPEDPGVCLTCQAIPVSALVLDAG
ncbi:molybdopterin-dependent oxidoreductase [Alcaligenaceae bacterium B3P038]|nr:molybdopterin-dependent oxidoreductase [Alcaligenaceae bacterium B3P038]